MSRLSVIRTTSHTFARLTVRRGRGGHPTDRWQDKSRDVRGGRVAQERRHMRHFARGAIAHDSLPTGATPWNITTCHTSRTPAS
jgi:hypothetical protein